MKKKILVLDAFTNGHEAALAFIQRQGWVETDCEIVFCGTHPNVFKRLIEGPAYAVVPIRNSIAGEVTEVMKNLAEFRESGYDLKEHDRLDLQINHCLLVPQHITRADELERVMSHEKAIQQCGIFLDSIGIGPDKRSKRDSTGNAAKAVARLGPTVKIGAIAPKAAAEEYGLRILAEGIQDVPDNKTTFVLLQNEATVRQVVVGIIGINGRFGKMLKGFFERLGCTVIGSDRDKPTSFTNDEVVQQAEAVIFSLSIKRTVEVIRSLIASGPGKPTSDGCHVRQAARCRSNA
jgi:prephenate dehydratase